MEYKIKIGEEFLTFLDRTKHYFYNEIKNPMAFKRFHISMIECLEGIKQFPKRYPIYKDNIHRAIFLEFAIYYAVKDEDKEIDVIIMVHNKQNDFNYKITRNLKVNEST